MAEGQNDGPIAPRRGLGGPILPPPPPEIAQDAERAKEEEARALQAATEREAQKQAQKMSAEEARRQRAAQREAEKNQKAEARARAAEQKSQEKAARKRPAAPAPAAGKSAPRRTRRAQLRL